MNKILYFKSENYFKKYFYYKLMLEIKILFSRYKNNL